MVLVASDTTSTITHVGAITMMVKLQITIGINNQSFWVDLVECDQLLSNWYLITYGGYHSYITGHQITAVAIYDEGSNTDE